MTELDSPLSSRGERAMLRNVLLGSMPAEALPTYLRWRLVAGLHRAGLTDVEIAEMTAMTTYTTCRIREGMGLSPNRCLPGNRDA